ncbi:uncharacterized protein P884DRAFT_193961 [Thermothelomyces heterothallicus CBS 202.75]|uniref:uncharacterized protein n=1 Tax=Thermothelomyces heterothallicus CBS 202.75 TaxID=1149848 RepID=UPI00374499A0
MAISYEPPRGDVVATLNFYSPPEDGSAPYNLAGDHPPGLPLRNFGSVAHDVLIHDIRGKESSFNLDNDAFQIIQNLPPSAEPSFTDDESIQKNYYPEVERLLLDTVPGAFKVVIFDHTIRRPNGKRQPVPRVHIDQTARSVAQRVRRHASSPEEAEHLLSSSRYRIINVWRPLNKGPVESNPLAFASSSTLRDEDVVPVEHRYPAEVGYVGQTAAIRYHPDQKWYYLSGMTGDERILLECFDSEGLKEGSAVKGGRVAHTAFDDPRTREGAEGRESIEVRALVFGS